MNNEKLTESAMRRGKKSAPPSVTTGQGQGTTRHPHITTEPPHIQDRAAQRAKLMAMLRRGPVDTLQARAVGIMSPASRIFELRQIGLEIITARLPNRVGVYHLVAEAGHGND